MPNTYVYSPIKAT